MDRALTGEVAAIVFDDDGRADVSALLAGVADTEFKQTGLFAILGSPGGPAKADPLEDWRVGEGIAEGYLTAYRNCFFPWPDGRDERKVGASLPGADLVGFHTDANGDRFAFGEVKTSAERKYPPQVMTKKDGMQQQIENLRDAKKDRDTLFRYLAHRFSGRPWQPRFLAAAARYLEDDRDVGLFGVLVRDVPPSPDDLRVRVHRLAHDIRGKTTIALLAIYLPADSITKLADRTRTARDGGGT